MCVGVIFLTLQNKQSNHTTMSLPHGVDEGFTPTITITVLDSFHRARR